MMSNTNNSVIGTAGLAIVPIFSALLAAVTIILCYGFSVQNGSVQPWPQTDITHTARHPPADYIFRYGMVEAMVILQLVWLAAYVWLKSEATRVSVSVLGAHVAFILGVLGANLLIMASVLIEPGDMDWSLHIFGATGFFIVTYVAVLLCTNTMQKIKDRDPLAFSNASMKLKWLDVYTLSVLLLLEIAGGQGLLPNHPYYGNVLEYLLTLFVLIWLSSLSYDWHNRLQIQLVLVAPPVNPVADQDLPIKTIQT